MAAPRLLVTGFGPFPGAPDNPTEALVRSLALASPEDLGASALEALALPTDYALSWTTVERITAEFAPDLVVHFGLSAGVDRIRLECVGRNRFDPSKPDAAGNVPLSAVLLDDGPDHFESTFPVHAMLLALAAGGFPASLSDDAGAYVCNATLYRSLHAAPAARRVGFVHVPPRGAGGFTPERLLQAARVLLVAATSAFPVAAESRLPEPARDHRRAR